jgi:hypothetical protein
MNYVQVKTAIVQQTAVQATLQSRVVILTKNGHPKIRGHSSNV